MNESHGYLSRQLITCIGNKRALLPFIGTAADCVREQLGAERLRIGDLFSGSGAVARYLRAYASEMYVNDLEPYAETLSRCYLSCASERDEGWLRRTHAELTHALSGPLEGGFLTELYAPADDGHIRAGERCFYTNRNARFLDTACRLIHALPAGQRPYFLGPLLSEASVKVNTGGVFKGFYKGRDGVGRFGGETGSALGRILADIELPFPLFSRFNCPTHIFREDACALAPRLPELDLLYLDPPYNQHPYGSNYFMLNLLVRYCRPARISPVSGIPEGWNRSRFNRACYAQEELRTLCAAANARYLLLSFSSEGFLGRDELLALLRGVGEVTVFEQEYAAFRASRNLAARSHRVREYLFLVKKG